MKGKKSVKIALIVWVAVAIVGYSMSQSSILKATDSEDANYGETVATGAAETQEAPAGATEYVSIPEAPAEEPEETECSAEIAVEFVGGDFQGLGTEVVLTAVTTGYQNPTYTWQYNDGDGWVTVAGAAESTYRFTVDETNYAYEWRVVVEE